MKSADDARELLRRLALRRGSSLTPNSQAMRLSYLLAIRSLGLRNWLVLEWNMSSQVERIAEAGQARLTRSQLMRD